MGQDKSVDKKYEKKDLKDKKGIKGKLPTVEDYYAGSTSTSNSTRNSVEDYCAEPTSTSSSTNTKNVTYLSEDYYRYLSTLSEEEQCRHLMKATSFDDEK